MLKQSSEPASNISRAKRQRPFHVWQKCRVQASDYCFRNSGINLRKTVQESKSYSKDNSKTHHLFNNANSSPNTTMQLHGECKHFLQSITWTWCKTCVIPLVINPYYPIIVHIPSAYSRYFPFPAPSQYSNKQLFMRRLEHIQHEKTAIQNTKMYCQKLVSLQSNIRLYPH
jgi:hypothetical protein